MSSSPRIAYFPDSFHEVNGVAHTSRNFAAYAQRHGIPMLCVRAGKKTQLLPAEGSVTALELGRSPLAVSLERDLYFDPLFFRYSELISQTVRDFRPDIIHITGPSELGFFGLYFAWKLRIPMVASWHTNVHEYAARRLGWLSRRFSPATATRLEDTVEALSLKGAAYLYQYARVSYAPNPQLCAMLEARTHRPCHLMQRGVETAVFTPAKRSTPPLDLPASRSPVLGYVGRLSVEKNVALLPQIDARLRALGLNPRWVIVGHGSDDDFLRARLPHATFTGVLRGDALSEAYANMDLFVFPSHTDTFGNVVLEALASGVPAIVTPHGGPATIVTDAPSPTATGRIVPDDLFATAIADLLADPVAFAAMRLAARNYAMTCSWDAVFDRVLAEYPIPTAPTPPGTPHAPAP